VTYDNIAASAEALSYRDKFRLAQLLIQLARKEEEEQYPEKRVVEDRKGATQVLDAELINYVAQRLQKLKPSKKSGLLNSIAAMFQFQGGIPESDKEKIIAELVKKRIVSIDQNNRVSYLA